MTRGRGKVFKVEVLTSYGILESLRVSPDRFYRPMMAKVGAQARKALMRGWLTRRGKHSLKYKGFRSKKKPHHKVINRVTKTNSVVFTSPALNPHEFGRQYRGTGVEKSPYARKQHIKDPPKLILTQRFRNYSGSHVQGYANSAMKRVLKEKDK